jgi:DNA-binding NtrC family response regulator
MTVANVLLVDDEEAFVATLMKRLERREVEVSAAYSGQEALDALEKADGAYEVVILDVKMPGMDGLAALSEIKRLHPLIEVIMLTGHATVESAIEGMKRGAFDYLMKPCELDILVTKVAEAAERRRAHEAKIMEARIREITERGRG